MSSPEQAVAAPLTPEQQFEHDVAMVLESALAHHHAGELADAEALYLAILEAKPDHGDVNYNLGVLLRQTDRIPDALPRFETALGLGPNNGQYWVAYIDALVCGDQSEAAWLAVEMAQQRGVKGPAMNALIERLSAPEEYAAAVAKQAAAQATAQQVEQEAQLAEAGDERSTGNPLLAKAKPTPQQMNQYASLFNKGRFAEAAKLARTLAERFPAHGLSWRALGMALYHSAQYAEAEAPLTKSVDLLPDDFEARTLLINVLNATGSHRQAEKACRSLIELRPDSADAHRQLATTLVATSRMTQAIESGRHAVELAPRSAPMHQALGVALMEDGQVLEAEKSFRTATELDPLDHVSRSNLLFCLTHRIDILPAQVAAEHREFGVVHETPVRTLWPQHANDRNRDRKLRVGLVSGDLFRHAVSSFLEPVLQHLVKDPGLSVHVYYNYVRNDNVTERLRAHATQWHGVTGMTDTALAEQIRRDRIDILIDLSGHTGRNRLLTFARKPAPVQASWIGYPGTTGLQAMDYYVTNGARACGVVGDQFTEKLAHLPAAAPFLPDAVSPPVNALPALHKGYITFGSFNRPSKLRHDVIKLWAQVLHGVPNSRMLLGALPETGDLKEVLGWFAAEGIGMDRLELRKRSGIAVYLQQHHQVDICLDTFPYAGGTTTLHALWMGVPTLTLQGHTMPGRAGGIILSQVDLYDFIAEDHADFVSKGIALASDIKALAELRNGMRARCTKSARFQPTMIADGMSRALRVMWQRWCDGLPAKTFEIGKAAETSVIESSDLTSPVVSAS